MVKIVAPNTNLNPSLLSKNIILCCGEDSNELINSFKELTSDNLEKFHEFRCYKFWKFPDLSLIWTGIGTGVLEPLLWEIFLNEETGKIVKQIILIGTAGQLPNSQKNLGEVYILDRAYIGGTAIDDDSIPQPLEPRFSRSSNLSTASIVSTDFYYGFSFDTIHGKYPAKIKRLTDAAKKHFYQTDMVDMEVGQFYYFCNLFAPDGELNYLAIKGLSNSVESFQEQIDNSYTVIKKALAEAINILLIIPEEPRN